MTTTLPLQDEVANEKESIFQITRRDPLVSHWVVNTILRPSIKDSAEFKKIGESIHMLSSEKQKK